MKSKELEEERAIRNVSWENIKWTMEQLRREAENINKQIRNQEDFGGRLTVEELVGAFISLFHKYKRVKNEWRCN